MSAAGTSNVGRLRGRAKSRSRWMCQRAVSLVGDSTPDQGSEPVVDSLSRDVSWPVDFACQWGRAIPDLWNYSGSGPIGSRKNARPNASSRDPRRGQLGI